MKKDFLSTQLWDIEELEQILDLGYELKKHPFEQSLKNKSIALLFFNPSLRTRSSFEVGIHELGGHSSTFDVNNQLWNLEFEEGVTMDGTKTEHIKDAAKVLSRYYDAICVRSFPKSISWEEDRQDAIIRAIAKYSSIPVISMESALYHPCQALADIMTIKEVLSPIAKKKFVLTWCNHPKSLPMAVPNSAAIIASQFGMDVTIINPPGFNLSEDVLNIVKNQCNFNGSEFTLSNSQDDLENADIVYAKSWGSITNYGNLEKEAAMKNDLKHWIIDKEKMEKTQNAKFMHCLPVRRNVVVTDEVIDSDYSIVYQQAENRLHAQKGLLKYLLGDA